MSDAPYPQKFTLSPDGTSLLVGCDTIDEFTCALILGLVECEDTSFEGINPLVDRAPFSEEQKAAIAAVTVFHSERWKKSFAVDGPKQRWKGEGKGYRWE